MTPGTKVGARRWPHASAHADCWEPPWGGTVLEQTDPRAWAGTIAFPEPEPNPIMVACHVAKHQDLLGSEIPVLWDFGDHSRVWWEKPSSLRPYDEDVALWRAERGRA